MCRNGLNNIKFIILNNYHVIKHSLTIHLYLYNAYTHTKCILSLYFTLLTLALLSWLKADEVDV